MQSSPALNFIPGIIICQSLDKNHKNTTIFETMVQQPYKRAWNTNFVRNKRKQLSDSEKAAINAQRREKYRLKTEQQREIRQARALLELSERTGTIKKRLKRSQEKSDKETAKKEIAEAADAMTAIKGSQLDSQSSQSSQLPSRYPKRVVFCIIFVIIII